MKQRVPRTAWYSPSRPAHHRRILIESDDPALAISDFSLFQQAGFDVAFCSGPGHDRTACPALLGEECLVLSHADAVIHALDPKLGVASAIRRHSPDTPLLVQACRPGGEDPVPPGSVAMPFACSVKGQIDALQRALAARHRQESGDDPAPD